MYFDELLNVEKSNQTLDIQSNSIWWDSFVFKISQSHLV